MSIQAASVEALFSSQAKSSVQAVAVEVLFEELGEARVEEAWTEVIESSQSLEPEVRVEEAWTEVIESSQSLKSEVRVEEAWVEVIESASDPFVVEASTDFALVLEHGASSASRVNVEWEAPLELGAQALLGADVPLLGDMVLDLGLSGPLRRVPWELDPLTSLAWTFVQNAVDYEVRRAGGGVLGDLVYFGPNPSLADYTIDSSYRVRGVNAHGEGPWSPEFTVTYARASLSVESRYVVEADRESFVFVQVSASGGASKSASGGGGVLVSAQAVGGGEREGVMAGVFVEVSPSGSGLGAHASGGGATVSVLPEAGSHLGAIQSLVAAGVVEGAFLARFPPGPEESRPTPGTSGRLRRRRLS